MSHANHSDGKTRQVESKGQAQNIDPGDLSSNPDLPSHGPECLHWGSWPFSQAKPLPIPKHLITLACIPDQFSWVPWKTAAPSISINFLAVFNFPFIQRACEISEKLKPKFQIRHLKFLKIRDYLRGAGGVAIARHLSLLLTYSKALDSGLSFLTASAKREAG